MPTEPVRETAAALHLIAAAVALRTTPRALTAADIVDPETGALLPGIDRVAHADRLLRGDAVYPRQGTDHGERIERHRAALRSVLTLLRAPVRDLRPLVKVTVSVTRMDLNTYFHRVGGPLEWGLGVPTVVKSVRESDEMRAALTRLHLAVAAG